MRRPSDLPIIDELGAEFRRLVAAELAPGRPAAPARPARRGERRRVARRAAIVAGLLCLIGTVAVAARLGGDGPASDTSPAALGAGASWQLSAHRHSGSLCLLLDASGGLSDSCGLLPGRRGVRATSALGVGVRYVVGLAGGEVAHVRVRVGGRVAAVATRAPEDRSRAGAAGVPAGVRWFVLEVALGGSGAGTTPRVGAAPASSSVSAPAQVTPLDRAGRPIGPAVLDCSLGVVGAECEHMAEKGAQSAMEGRGG
jgi:hypothetical protein